MMRFAIDKHALNIINDDLSHQIRCIKEVEGMAEILRTRRADGRVEYLVEWRDNDGIGRDRLFGSFGAAERYALKVEADLLNEVLSDLQAAPACLASVA